MSIDDMGNIIIHDRIFEFEEENLMLDELKPIKYEDAVEVLSLSKKLCDERGIIIFLFWGTLLGAIREHDLIKGDEDVDVVCTDEQKLVDSIPYFYEKGLKLIRYVHGNIYTFRSSKGCYIDFYIKRPLKFSLWAIWCCKIGNIVIPNKHFKKFIEIDFLGNKYLVPGKPEKILEVLYGKTWRIPQKGHLWHSDQWSHYIWSTYICPYLIRFLMNLIGWKYWRHKIRSQYNSQEESLSDWNRVIEIQKSIRKRRKK